MPALKSREEKTRHSGSPDTALKSIDYITDLPVFFSDVDANGHVNNKHYNSYCDEAVMNVFQSAGLNISEMNRRGFGPIVYRAEYQYLAELKYGQSIRIRTRVSFPKKTRAIFEHTIYGLETPEGVNTEAVASAESGGAVEQPVCRAVSYGMWLNLKTKKPHRLDDSTLAAIIGR